jgi:hypothetical protein
MNKTIIIHFFVFFCGILSFTLNAQENDKPIEVSLGSIKTALKQNAISIGLSYSETLDNLWEKQDFLFAGDRSLFLITPRISVQSGNEDAFSSITVKITGLAMLFDTIQIAGILTPNTSKIFHTFPVSAGIETNNKFNIVNGIAEFGWVPWYQSATRKTPAWLKTTKLGIFVQTGYKFAIDTTGITSVGGEADQSKESTDHAIFRLKSDFGIDTRSLFELSGTGIGLLGNATGWYDFLNSAIYYTLQAKLRLYLSDNHDKFFDFHYQKGSGAPNFNQGDQFGIGLTVTF